MGLTVRFRAVESVGRNISQGITLSKRSNGSPNLVSNPHFKWGVYLEPLRGFVLTPAYGRSSKLSLYLQPPMAALSLIRLTYFSNLSLSSCSEM